MKQLIAILLMTGLLAALPGCTDMHDQQSIQPQEAPRRTAPAVAVPFQGKTIVTWASQLDNPIAADPASIERGEHLYQINCELCHGDRDNYLGKVGKKLNPPPPSLNDPRIGALQDGDRAKVQPFRLIVSPRVVIHSRQCGEMPPVIGVIRTERPFVDRDTAQVCRLC